AEALVATSDGQPVGYALFFHTMSTFLARPGIYLEDLYVQPNARGRGVGKALLRTLAAIARDRGCARLEWSVLNWNEPAIRFYEALGAKPQGEWMMYRMTVPEITALADAPLEPGPSGPR
ncbi:MAG TPA: GNAT family N-acetyltransferase, partial [Tepidisphaeraceae bacterium]|nr:GNAT family N-acetyltransferase [Tepidisphaeraceae bacterium]